MTKLYEYKENAVRPEQPIPFYIYKLHAIGNAFHVPLHWHNETEIILPLTKGYVEIDGFRYEFDSGDIIFVNANELHSTYIHTEGIIYHIVFLTNAFSLSHSVLYFNSIFEKINTNDLLFPSFIKEKTSLNTQIMPFLQNILLMDDYYDLNNRLLLNANYQFIVSILYQNQAFLTPIECKSHSSTIYIKKSIQYMNLHIREPINIKDISNFLGISSGYFCKIFKDYTNIAPSQYFIFLKLEKACKYLISGDSITSVSQKIGIDNISYFIRLFKKKYGVTPNKFKNLRNTEMVFTNNHPIP